jgi:hypothetical protein
MACRQALIRTSADGVALPRREDGSVDLRSSDLSSLR